MPTIVTSHFSNELNDWNHAIEFYYEEMEGLTRQLGEVISRNSIIGIAAKVEAEQEIVNQARKQFEEIQDDINEQLEQIHSDDSLIEDQGVTEEMKQKQSSLRQQMREAEKNYVDVKFNCYRFLSDTLKK